MLLNLTKKITKPLFLLSLAGVSVAAFLTVQLSQQNQATHSYIISANDFNSLQTKINQLGAKPSHELSIINAVAVDLSDSQLAELKQQLDIKVSDNHQVELSGWAKGKRRWQPKAVVADLIDASDAHHVGNYGGGVTIGFLDTGLDQLSGLSTDLYGYDKAWGTYDAVNNSVSNYDDEASGHGTHVASIASNSDFDIYGKIYGVAPNAALVGIKAFDRDGKASYADVIRGIDWAVQVKDQINLRVLNMSFSGPVRSHYWDDPLNQAVMKAWQAGIVVVASAGNRGPEPMTIGVPGNVPYIITVGAMTDNYTSTDSSDDKLASFSSAGPTVEAFVKPEIVAPGGHLSGLMSYDSQIVVEHPEFHDGGRYFEMSGTSQAAAVVSGVVALMLTDNPALTPDDVKCRIMDGARAAMDADNKLAYSIFQQGAGVVNAADALMSNASNCANQQLDIAKDLSGEQHFYGPSNINSDGSFYIEGLGAEYVWNISDILNSDGGFVWKNGGFVWKNGGFVWKNGLGTNTSIWNNSAELTSDGGFVWKNSFATRNLTCDLSNELNSDGGFVWKNSTDSGGYGCYLAGELNSDGGFVWKNGGFVWKNSLESNGIATIGVNNWVEQQ